MAEIKIRIGAAADASLLTVFRPLIQAARQARRQILSEFQSIPRQMGQGFRAGASDIAASMRRLEGAARSSTRQISAGSREAATDMAKEFSRAARQAAQAMRREHALFDREMRAAAREKAAEARRVAREQAAAARQAAREQAALEREQARQHAYWHKAKLAQARQRYQDELREARRAAREAANLARQQARELDRFATRTSHRATRFFWPNMPMTSMARRAASEVMRGIGVDPTISGALSRNVELETQAVEAVNQARLSGQDVDPRVVAQRVREVSNRRGLSRDDAMTAVELFQKKTGDLNMALDLLDKFAERAGATATKLSDMADAAGDVAMNLGDVPNLGEKIIEVLDAVAAQGARGGVEVRDLATHMARLASAATAFSGDTAENMKKMGALAQLARGTGGAPSAAEAARSVVGFANTLQKGARIKAFEEAGVSVFTDASRRHFKDPIQLIKDALIATGGDRLKMNKLFMDVVGARAVRGLTTAFNEAGGGQAGLAAVDKTLEKFMKNLELSQEQLDRANAERMATTAAKVQVFQNKLDDIANEAQLRLLPALERLEPQILKFVEWLGKAIEWSAENPGKAIAAAIALSIARAGIESVIRTAIERVILGALGRGLVGRGGLPLPPGTAGPIIIPGGGGGGGKPGAPGGAGRIGGRFLGRPTIGGVVGAAGIGLTAGMLVHDYIDTEGKYGYDENVTRLNELSMRLSKLQGRRLKEELPEIERAFEKIKEDRSLIDQVFGFSDVEFDSFEGFLQKKKREAEQPIKEEKDVVKVLRGKPGETVESLKKRVLERDPTVEVVSSRFEEPERAAPAETPFQSVVRAMSAQGQPGAGDPLVDALETIGGYKRGSTGTAGAPNQTVVIAQLMSEQRDLLRQVNRNLEALGTKTLNVRDVTPQFPSLDPTGTGR